MASFNKCILIGNLVRDPALSYTPSEKAVCNFDLAINDSYKNAKGEKQEQVTFVPVTVWGKQAESVAEYLKKGRQCLVEGAIRQDRWEDKEGNKRSKLKLVAINVRFLGSPPKTEQKQPDEPPVNAQETQADAGDHIPF